MSDPMDPRFEGSAAYLITSKLFLGNTRFSERTYGAAAAVSEILKNNPRRVEFVIINPSIGDLYISNDPSLVTSFGFIVPAGGGSLIFNVLEDGETVAERFYCYAPAGAITVYVMEVERV